MQLMTIQTPTLHVKCTFKYSLLQMKKNLIKNDYKVK